MIRSCEWHGTQAVEFTKRDYTALLVPSVGANLVRLAHTRLGVEVLRTPSEREHDEFLRRPHVYGVPILFPLFSASHVQINTRPSYSPANSSTIGATMRRGPHHSAPKSIKTGSFEAATSP